MQWPTSFHFVTMVSSHVVSAPKCDRKECQKKRKRPRVGEMRGKEEWVEYAPRRGLACQGPVGTTARWSTRHPPPNPDSNHSVSVCLSVCVSVRIACTKERVLLCAWETRPDLKSAGMVLWGTTRIEQPCYPKHIIPVEYTAIPAHPPACPGASILPSV